MEKRKSEIVIIIWVGIVIVGRECKSIGIENRGI